MEKRPESLWHVLCAVQLSTHPYLRGVSIGQWGASSLSACMCVCVCVLTEGAEKEMFPDKCAWGVQLSTLAYLRVYVWVSCVYASP